MYKPSHTPGFKHKKRVIKSTNGSHAGAARPPEDRPEFQVNVKKYKGDREEAISDRMRDIERRVDRLNRAPQSSSASSKSRKRRSVSKDRGSRYADDLEPMLMRQLQELTQRMDEMQSYGSVNNLNLSPRGKNQHLSKFGDSPSRHVSGYHSDGEAEPPMVRSFPALPGHFGQPPMPMGGVGAASSNGYMSDSGMRGYPPHVLPSSYDSSPYGRHKISPSYQSERDDIRKSLTQQNMELQQALQDTRNEYLKAMTMLEGETYERQQLERKTGDLTNKLAASRQALAVTQTALSGLQDATEESSRTRDIRDIEIEKYLSEIKVKDSKIAALEHRAKDFDDHMNINLSKKDETIHKLQKKLTDALDTAYKAENDASTVSKDLSIAEQEVYSLRNRLTHMDLDHQETIKRMEKDHKNKIETLNESLNKALSAQDNSEKNVLRSATLEAKNIELEARVRYLDSVVIKGDRERNGKDEEIVRLREDLAALTHEKSLSASSLTLELEDKVRQLEKNANSMKEREASLITERNNLQAEIDMYKKRVDELSDSSSNPQVTELEYARGLLQKENDHMKRQLQALEQELGAVKATLRNNDEQILDSLKKQVSAKEDEIRQLYADLKASKEENATLTKAVGENSNASSEAVIHRLTDERDKLSNAKRELEAELREASAKQSDLQRELAIKAKEAADLDRELDIKTNELTSLQTKINSNTFVSPTAPPEPVQVRPSPVAKPDSAPAPAVEEPPKAVTPSQPVREPEPEPEPEPQPAPEPDLASDMHSEAGDGEGGKKKKKKKKKGSKSGKGRKTPKSSKSSVNSDEDLDDDDASVHTTTKDVESPTPVAVPEPIVEVPASAESRQPSPPAETGRTTPFRRAGFSVPTPEPESQPASAAGARQSAGSSRNIGSAGTQPAPVKPASGSSNPPGSAPLNNIFNNVTPSPAIGSRKQLNSSDGRSSAGTDRGGSAVEKNGYNALRGGTGNSRATSAKSNVSAVELRQELMECNAEKKRLKKGISKWNTDFLLTHNREAGVEDKSSDAHITKLYEDYHEISVLIKSKEEQLEGMKIYG